MTDAELDALVKDAGIAAAMADQWAGFAMTQEQGETA